VTGRTDLFPLATGLARLVDGQIPDLVCAAVGPGRRHERSWVG
jgi:hypothetical protein